MLEKFDYFSSKVAISDKEEKLFLEISWLSGTVAGTAKSAARILEIIHNNGHC